MFKFNFEVEDSETENKACSLDLSQSNQIENCTDNETNDWYPSEEVKVTDDILENICVCELNSTQKDVGKVSLKYLVSGFLLEDIKENGDQVLDIKKAEEKHSDLIPAVYEGGAKIWECTDDLLEYLSINLEAEDWKGKDVLDLGCGSGLLGIFAFKNGANVTLQDYNKDVLEKITIPNVVLNSNTKDSENELYDVEDVRKRVCFYSGDWAKWSESLNDGKLYDFILTSETIYNPQNQQKLLNCMHKKLKPDGKIFVAAKIYYFGVGGGLRQFENIIKKDGRFQFKSLWMATNGVNREIIQLTKIKE